MGKRLSVGKSERTPAKHDLMTKLYGREIGAAHKHPGIDRLLWLDLTAGDGLPSEPGREWGWSCSPGILARLARYPDRQDVPQAHKPVTVILHEVQPGTYRKLIRSLGERLPNLKYEQVDEGEWHCGPTRVVVRLMSGADADLSGIDRRTAVMVSNDPNAMTDWAMPSGMPGRIRSLTPWFLGLSTMGCNPAGLKRLEPEIRMGWYGHIGSMTGRLPNHHDLHLCAIERDDAQWAYLITAPEKWRAAVERDAVDAFGKHGLGLDTAWWRTGGTAFGEICDRLFQTRKELGR